MQPYFGITTLIFMIGCVFIRTTTLKKENIQAVEFGTKDKKDYFLIPFAVFYFYTILANAFRLPTIQGQTLFHSEQIAWLGVLFCLIAIVFFLWSMISFKKSFRVGLVDNKSQGLITKGAFAMSRNPIYVSFILMLIGQFFIDSHWILLIYIFVGTATLHHQVLKEEKFLQEQYGEEFTSYCQKVRRYI